jgi:M6 family metalloprotease-like protein
MFAISLNTGVATSAPKIATGAACKSLNNKVTFKGKVYTCQKKGKKLVWSKGVTAKSASSNTNPTPAPTPQPTSTQPATPDNLTGQVCTKENEIVRNSAGEFWCLKSPDGQLRWSRNNLPNQPPSTQAPIPTPSSTLQPSPGNEVQLPREGSLCSTIGAKITNSTGTMRCSWAGHARTTEEAKQNLIWRSLTVYKTSNSQTNNYPSKPVENAACSNSGDTFDVSGGYLECRWVSGMKLQWIKINTVKKTFVNAKSPVSIDVCKLQMSASKADRTGRNAGGGMVGFPLVDSNKNGMFIDGMNEVLIAPIDFPDFPGGSELKAQLEYDKKWLNDWYNYFSGGKSKFNITSFDSWIRMPKARSEYPSDSKNTNPTAADSVARQAVQAQPFIDEISKLVNLNKFSTVYVFFPEGEYEISDFIIRNYPFKTKEGTKNLNYFSWGRNLTGMETLKWSFYIHETLHDFNIIGHAPGNGWPLGIMTNQSGISYAINPWEQFLFGWLPPEQIYCDDAATLKPTTISLSPMEREDKQTKMAVIKLSATRAIVVESHGIDKWSDFKFADRAFPPGFYSVMAYIIDLDKQVAAPVNQDGSSQYNDEWAWAVWQKVQGTPSNQFNINVGNRNNLAEYVAVLGDSFVIEGVRIKFVGTGDYETIEISKA